MADPHLDYNIRFLGNLCDLEFTQSTFPLHHNQDTTDPAAPCIVYPLSLPLRLRRVALSLLSEGAG